MSSKIFMSKSWSKETAQDAKRGFWRYPFKFTEGRGHGACQCPVPDGNGTSQGEIAVRERIGGRSIVQPLFAGTVFRLE